MRVCARRRCRAKVEGNEGEKTLIPPSPIAVISRRNFRETIKVGLSSVLYHSSEGCTLDDGH